MINEKIFIPATVEEREIELDDGSKATFHFRHLEVTHFELFAMQTNSKDEEVAARAAAVLLAAGLCTADGKPALTLEQVVRIKRSVFQRMFRALLEVNEYGVRGEGKPGNA